MTVSSIPGVAMRATKAGVSIGRALEDSNCTEGKECKVLILVNTTYSTGSLIKETMKEDGIDLDAIPGDLDVGRIVLAHMLQEKKDITASSAFSELFTDRVVAGLEIITPRVIADTVIASKFEPAEKDLGLKLGQGGRFIITNNASGSFSTTFGNTASGSASSLLAQSASASLPVITFDNLGNAFFAGQVTADVVSANKISGLEVITEKLSLLSGEVASASVPYETMRQELAALGLMVTDLSGAMASLSADYADLVGRFQAVDVQFAALASADARFSGELAGLASSSDGLDRYLDLNGDILGVREGMSGQGITILRGGVRVESVGLAGTEMAFLSDAVFFGRPYFNT
ncbi:MAG: hypothetical protein AAB538_02265, partial [Patescibacteria group bacterium]